MLGQYLWVCASRRPRACWCEQPSIQVFNIFFWCDRRETICGWTDLEILIRILLCDGNFPAVAYCVLPKWFSFMRTLKSRAVGCVWISFNMPHVVLMLTFISFNGIIGHSHALRSECPCYSGVSEGGRKKAIGREYISFAHESRWMDVQIVAFRKQLMAYFHIWWYNNITPQIDHGAFHLACGICLVSLVNWLVCNLFNWLVMQNMYGQKGRPVRQSISHMPHTRTCAHKP